MINVHFKMRPDLRSRVGTHMEVQTTEKVKGDREEKERRAKRGLRDDTL